MGFETIAGCHNSFKILNHGTFYFMVKNGFTKKELVCVNPAALRKKVNNGNDPIAIVSVSSSHAYSSNSPNSIYASHS